MSLKAVMNPSGIECSYEMRGPSPLSGLLPSHGGVLRNTNTHALVIPPVSHGYFRGRGPKTGPGAAPERVQP